MCRKLLWCYSERVTSHFRSNIFHYFFMARPRQMLHSKWPEGCWLISDSGVGPLMERLFIAAVAYSCGRCDVSAPCSHRGSRLTGSRGSTRIWKNVDVKTKIKRRRVTTSSRWEDKIYSIGLFMHETAPSLLYNDHFARLLYYVFVTAINLGHF